MTGDGHGKIGKTVQDSQPYWPEAPKRPLGIGGSGAPNILVILFDDVGFSDFGCYGSPIATPAIDAIAKRGLRYTGFHTTAMCSTTRAALLTGRNHHSVGVGCLANFDSGYPGYRGKISREAGTIAEMLRPHGYRNYMLGKWHVTPLTESGATGPGGKLPVNTSGGLVSKGHPVGATGLSMLAELATQLRGEAGARQVKGAEIALAENGGGVIGMEEAVASVVILQRS